MVIKSFLLVHLLSMVAASVIAGNRPRKAATELLLPIGSTTALMCEPILASDSSATWYRNGEKVATVTSTSNFIYGGRNLSSEQAVPAVGFLIMTQIAKEDEGEYWCRKDSSGEAGEVFNLEVAFVAPIAKERTITLEPSNPLIGSFLRAHCPTPDAVPKPKISWKLDGDPISSVSGASAFPNGTLLIAKLSPSHFGKLECIVSNFAGQASAHIHLKASSHFVEPSSNNSFRCNLIFRNSMLWFLIGCLVTSCAVLLYLLCVLVLLRPRNRLSLRPSMWLRPHPLLGPGFRKTVVPTPDFVVESRLVPERSSP